VSISGFLPSGDRRTRRQVASVGAALSVVMLVAVVWMGLAAGAARGGTPTNVTFKQDIFPSPRDQRVEIEFIDQSGGYRPPIRVYGDKPVDLGPVEFFQVTDSRESRDYSFSSFYYVSVQRGDGPLTLTLTELHRGTYSSAFRVDERCRVWRPSTGSVPVTC